MAGVQGNGTLDGDGTAAGPAVTPTAAAVFDWQAEYAYSLGLQAFIYGFPYVYLAQCRYKWTNQPRDPKHVPYSAGRAVLACPGRPGCHLPGWRLSEQRHDVFDRVGRPHEEPVILSHPDMGDRYFSFQLGGMSSDNVDYVGQRTTGSAAGDFALIGPGWEGELPEGVKATARGPDAVDPLSRANTGRWGG